MDAIQFMTVIPNEFIDKHMLAAKPVYSVIYIYGYRQYSKGATQICCEEVAEVFDITIKDVQKAWKYWHDAGLVEILSQDDGIIMLVFLDVRPAKLPAQEIMPKKAPPQHDYVEYTLEDVERHLQDKEVQRLFEVVHVLLGKPLTDAERQMYLGFYDDLGLPVNVIALLLEYCIDKNKRHNNYLRTVAFDWSSRGIRSEEEAEEYISLFNNEYREILRYFGISGREPIDKEIEYMQRWLKQEQWIMPVIKLACEKTVMSKGSASFAYADGIFRKWKADGIHTTEQIEALEKTYYDNVKQTRKAAAKNSGRRVKVQNYEGRKWDYEKLAQMEQEYIDRKIAE